MKHIIIDTDLGNDSDDAGALAIAHQLANRNECQILAITSSTSRRDGAECISAINRYYHRDDIPIGMTQKKDFLDEKDGYGQYSRAVIKQYSHRFVNQEVPTSTSILRRVLSKSTQKVLFICLGPLNNIKDLMLSKADAISSEDGMSLIKNHVERFIIMGGDFSPEHIVFMLGNKPMHAEWNILQDIDSAQYTIHHLPCPILFIPYAIGLIRTGHQLFSLEDYESPIKLSYEVHNNGPRQSWDPIAVYVAIRGERDLFKISSKGFVNVLNSGKTVFTPQRNGFHQYLSTHIDEKKTINVLNEYII